MGFSLALRGLNRIGSALRHQALCITKRGCVGGVHAKVPQMLRMVTTEAGYCPSTGLSYLYVVLKTINTRGGVKQTREATLVLTKQETVVKITIKHHK